MPNPRLSTYEINLTPSQIRKLNKLVVGQTRTVRIRKMKNESGFIAADFPDQRVIINQQGRVVYAYRK